MFGKRFENIKWTVSTAERQLTYPEDNPKGHDAYAEDGSAEDDIDTEDGSGRAQFRYGSHYFHMIQRGGGVNALAHLCRVCHETEMKMQPTWNFA